MMKIEHMRTMKTIKLNAKAIYLLSDLNEVWTYLWGKIDDKVISEDEADRILNIIDDECKNLTVAQINKFKKCLSN